METVDERAEARGHADAAVPAAPDDPGLTRRWLAATTAVTATPILVALGRVLTSSWLPVSDLAFLEAKVRDVGGADTPLTGVYSRLGFDHPGPLESWVLAPLYRLSGSDPRALLVAAGLVNLLAVAVALTVANRRGGRALVAVAAVTLLLVEAALAGVESNLVDPWNPTVAVLPFFAALLLGWDCACGRLRSLWLLVLLASWAMQCHAGYLPVAGTLLLAVAAALSIRTVRGHQEWTWRPVAAAALVGAAVWIGPLVDQVAGDGNLAAILEANQDATEPAVGLSGAAGVLAAELRPLGPWAGATERLDSLTAAVVAVPSWWLLVPAAALGLAGATGWRRRRTDLVVLAVLLAATAAAGWLAIGRITGPPFAYLLHWTWAIAAATYLAATWALWLLTGPDRSVVATRAAQVAGAAVGGFALVAGVAASATEGLPNDRYSVAAVDVAAPLRAALDPATPYSVEVIGGEYILLGPAILLDLERHGFDVCEVHPPDEAESPLGRARTCDAPRPDHVVVATDTASAEVLRADPTVEVVSESSTLSVEERGELAELTGRIPAGDLLWAAVARRDGTDITPPGPDAGYTVADARRAIDLRQRAVHVAVGLRSAG
jgi:hypothetical protein